MTAAYDKQFEVVSTISNSLDKLDKNDATLRQITSKGLPKPNQEVAKQFLTTEEIHYVKNEYSIK